MITIVLPNKQRKEVSNWRSAADIVKSITKKQKFHNKILGNKNATHTANR